MNEPAVAPIPDPIDPDLVAAARETSDALRALSHEQRLLILSILRQGSKSVGELEALLSLPQPAVSQQLARLRMDDLVTGRRDGRTIHYALNEDVLWTVFAGLANLLGYRFERPSVVHDADALHGARSDTDREDASWRTG